MIIGHNIPALLTHLNMKNNNQKLAAAMQRLTTGSKISSAKDDAAGLTIANKLAYQVGNLNKASENATNGISMVQTVDGALSEMHNMLQRMRELAVQAGTSSLTESDRTMIQSEIDELTDEINALANRTEYNRIKLLAGEASRITEMEPNVAKPLYVSHDVASGDFMYDINQVGESAMCTISGSPPIATANSSDPIPPANYGTFTINGMSVSVGAGDTYGSVKAAFSEICGYARLTYDTTDGEFRTNEQGSRQFLNIGGSTQALDLFGLSPTSGTLYGKDAILAIPSSSGGTNIPGLSDGASYTSDGNQVTVTGTGGQIIQFNIFQTTTPQIDVTLSIKDYGPVMLQVGPNYNMAISMEIPKLNSETLRLEEYHGTTKYRLLNYETSNGASHAIGRIDDAIKTVSIARTRLGAYQNRLEATVRSLDTAAENTEASRSLIQDTDMAREMTEYTSRNVMYQAGLAILGQANQRPGQIIQLLQ